MALPSERVVTVADAWDQMRKRLTQLRAAAIAVRGRIANGTVNAEDVVDRILVGNERLRRSMASVLTVLQSSECQTYARLQLRDPDYDISAEISAVVSALNAIETWIEANYPKTADGHYDTGSQIDETMNRVVPRIFSAGEMNGLAPLLDDLIILID